MLIALRICAARGLKAIEAIPMSDAPMISKLDAENIGEIARALSGAGGIERFSVSQRVAMNGKEIETQVDVELGASKVRSDARAHGAC